VTKKKPKPQETITVAKYKELMEGPTPKKRHKYGAKKTVWDGKSYPSKAEAERAAYLHALKCAGEVLGYIEQPKWELGVRENVYRPDFLVWYRDGRVVAEDVKGAESPKFRRDKRMWARYSWIPLHIVTRNYGRGTAWKVEVVQPNDPLLVCPEEPDAFEVPE